MVRRPHFFNAVWTETRDKVGQILQNGVAATIAGKLAQRSEELKDLISNDLIEQAQMLRENPPRSVGDLTKGRTSTTKALVDAGDKLFGWSKQDAPSTLIQVGYIRELETEPAKPAIELMVAENV